MSQPEILAIRSIADNIAVQFLKGVEEGDESLPQLSEIIQESSDDIVYFVTQLDGRLKRRDLILERTYSSAKKTVRNWLKHRKGFREKLQAIRKRQRALA